MSLADILAAAARARTLTVDLERTNRAEDRNQVAAGVRHELDTILRAAQKLQEDASAAASGDRPGKVRADAPATSRAAAGAIIVATGTTRWLILEFLAIAQSGQGGVIALGGGCTDLEIQQALNLNPSTERPRRGELVDAGLVTGTGTRHHVTGFGGSSEWTIWALTQAGADLYRERVPGPPLVVTHAGDPTLF